MALCDLEPEGAPQARARARKLPKLVPDTFLFDFTMADTLGTSAVCHQPRRNRARAPAAPVRHALLDKEHRPSLGEFPPSLGRSQTTQ